MGKVTESRINQMISSIIPEAGICWIPHLDNYSAYSSYRGMVIKEIMDYWDSHRENVKSIENTYLYFVGIKKSIDYYLDAIWC